MPKITPCLWFDNQAEEAAELYTSLFPNSKTGNVSHYDDASAEVSGMPKGSVLTVAFELDGQDFVALNGGPQFKFTEAVSFMINCKDQEEVDHYWDGLTAGGGEEGPCGWCKDKFGLSWQVVPKRLEELLSDPDRDKSQRVMRSMLKMKKIVVADLEKAVAGP